MKAILIATALVMLTSAPVMAQSVTGQMPIPGDSNASTETPCCPSDCNTDDGAVFVPNLDDMNMPIVPGQGPQDYIDVGPTPQVQTIDGNTIVMPADIKAPTKREKVIRKMRKFCNKFLPMVNFTAACANIVTSVAIMFKL